MEAKEKQIKYMLLPWQLEEMLTYQYTTKNYTAENYQFTISSI